MELTTMYSSIILLCHRTRNTNTAIEHRTQEKYKRNFLQKNAWYCTVEFDISLVQFGDDLSSQSHGSHQHNQT